MDQKPKKPFSVYLLRFLIIFIAASGLMGGLSFLISPSGELLQIPLSLLNNTPFDNYLIPGIILLICIGLYPTIVSFGLFNRKENPLLNSVNLYKENHWSWTGSVYIGIMLIIWMDVQVMLIGYNAIIQFIYAILGVLTVICALIPSVKNFYLKR